MKSIVTNRNDIVVPWVLDRVDGMINSDCQSVGLMSDLELVAGIVYSEYNGVNVTGTVAGEGKYWLNREFLWFCFYYPFVQLKCKRMTGLIAASNSESRKFHEHLGFVLEATLKDAHPTGDILVYVIRPENCRWLNLLKGNKNGQADEDSSNSRLHRGSDSSRLALS